MPRPVVALHDVAVTGGWEHARHRHTRAQLLYTLRGIINCEVADGIWIVPPNCAVWIPGGAPHAARSSGTTECYCLFVSPEAAPDLPKTCCTLSVSPLLRELLLKAAVIPDLYTVEGPEGRLIAALLDELATAPVEDLHLPMPRDPRLRRLTRMMLASPADRATFAEWARRIGMSERSLSRVLIEEVGMSFGRWRRQLHVILSLQRISRGESVQAVSLGLGYESASGFVTMFRKVMGKPPARYLQERRRTASAGEDSNRKPGIMLPEMP